MNVKILNLRRTKRKYDRMLKQVHLVQLGMKEAEKDHPETFKEAKIMLRSMTRHLRAMRWQIRKQALEVDHWLVYVDGDDHSAIEHTGRECQFVNGKSHFQKAILIAEKLCRKEKKNVLGKS